MKKRNKRLKERNKTGILKRRVRIVKRNGKKRGRVQRMERVWRRKMSKNTKMMKRG